VRKLFSVVALVLVLSLGLWLGVGAIASGAGPYARHAAPIHATRAHPVHPSHPVSRLRAAEATPANGEQAGKAEGAPEPAGEAQPGHEDPAGQNVDHQCPPNCDTAAGEVP
jgi:hypothetical protein